MNKLRKRREKMLQEQKSNTVSDVSKLKKKKLDESTESVKFDRIDFSTPGLFICIYVHRMLYLCIPYVCIYIYINNILFIQIIGNKYIKQVN